MAPNVFAAIDGLRNSLANKFCRVPSKTVLTHQKHDFVD
jgi:hypothetical protein